MYTFPPKFYNELMKFIHVCPLCGFILYSTLVSLYGYHKSGMHYVWSDIFTTLPAPNDIAVYK